MLSRETQLTLERELKRLRRGFTCNLHRLNRWAAHLNEGACHEDLNDVGELLRRDSLVGSPTLWDGVLGATVTYDEITNALRANVISLIEEYFGRVLLMVAGELDDMPLPARDFNAQLDRIGGFLSGESPWLIEEADFTLRTDFGMHPPAVSIETVLERELGARRRRDYTGELFGKTVSIATPATVRNPQISTTFAKRAAWLESRLRDLGWSTSDPAAWGGPDRKTVEKILRGEAVKNGSLKKLADALSKPSGSEPVTPSGIPAE